MNSWRRSSTRSCLSLLLTKNSLPLVAHSRCHMYVTLSLPSFNLFQNFRVDGCNINLMHRNKVWSILFWSSCHRVCCNILDAVFCDLRVVLQWEYNYSRYFLICARSLFTTDLHMELPFDRWAIDNLWETIGSPSKSLVFVVSDSK